MGVDVEDKKQKKPNKKKSDNFLSRKRKI